MMHGFSVSLTIKGMPEKGFASVTSTGEFKNIVLTSLARLQ